MNVSYIIVIVLFTLVMILEWLLNLNQRRAFTGIVLLLFSGIFLYRLVASSETWSISTIALACLPGLSGLSLFAIIFSSRLESGIAEYIACSVGSGSVFSFYLTFDQPAWKQGGVTLLMTLISYGIQRVRGRPITHKSDPQRMLASSMHAAAWTLGKKRMADGQYEDPQIQEMISSIEKLGHDESEQGNGDSMFD